MFHHRSMALGEGLRVVGTHRCLNTYLAEAWEVWSLELPCGRQSPPTLPRAGWCVNAAGAGSADVGLQWLGLAPVVTGQLP